MRVTHRIKKMHVKRNSMENQAVSKYRKVERHLLCLNILSSVSKLKGPPKMSTVCKMWYCISSKSINIGKSVITSKASPTNPDHIWDTFLCRENFVGMNAALSARTTLCETIHGFLICLLFATCAVACAYAQGSAVLLLQVDCQIVFGRALPTWRTALQQRQLAVLF